MMYLTVKRLDTLGRVEVKVVGAGDIHVETGNGKEVQDVEQSEGGWEVGVE